MENRLIDDDLLDDITSLEAVTSRNFPGAETYATQLLSVIETAESLADAINAVLNGEASYIEGVTPSELKTMNDQCRALYNTFGKLETAVGIGPIHVIRLLREIQATTMLIAQTPDLFTEDRITELKDVWGS